MNKGLDAKTVTAQVKISDSWRSFTSLKGKLRFNLGGCCCCVLIDKRRDAAQLPGSSWYSASRVIMVCSDGDALMVLYQAHAVLRVIHASRAKKRRRDFASTDKSAFIWPAC